MKPTHRYFSLVAALCLVTSVFAQDVHFSQMEYAPMNLNPALAGANSPMQAIVNYRSQWSSVAIPYNTVGASFDARFNEKNRSKAGIIAAGIGFYNDQAGDNKVSTNNVNLSAAYHLILDKTSTLGLGIYGGFGQRTLGLSDAKWASQYDGSTYDNSIDPGETFSNASFSYLDAGAGMVYTFKKFDGYMTQNNQRAFNAGVAFFHVNRPSYSYIDAGMEKLYVRWSVFFNGEIGLANSNGALLPGVYFNRQKSSMEILYGTYYRINVSEGSQVTGFNKAFRLHFGLFHRWGDALVAKTMLEWSSLSAGFAYDINISSLNRASNARGGMEIFLRYNMTGKPGSRAMMR